MKIRLFILLLISAVAISGCVGLQKRDPSPDDLMRAAEQTRDAPLTSLAEDTTPSPTDLAYSVKDPAGTPLSKKVTWANIFSKAHGLADGYVIVDEGVLTGGAEGGTGGGDVSVSGTPSQYDWTTWVDDATVQGTSVAATSVVCTDANGLPTPCTNLTDVVQYGVGDEEDIASAMPAGSLATNTLAVLDGLNYPNFSNSADDDTLDEHLSAIDTAIGAFESGSIDISGTPAQYEWMVWVDADTAKGVAVGTSEMVCTDTNGEPVACESFDMDLTEDYVLMGNASNLAAPTAPATALEAMETARGDEDFADYMASTTFGGIDDGAGGDPEGEIFYEVIGSRCYVDFYINGVKAGAGDYVSFTVPAACTSSSSRSYPTEQVNVRIAEDNTAPYDTIAYVSTPGMIYWVPNTTTIRVYRTAQGSAGTDWDDNALVKVEGAINLNVE